MVTSNTTWTLVKTVISPYVATYRGSWRRIWGEFTSDEMTPEAWVAGAQALLAQDGNLAVLSGALWAPEGSEALSDHWYIDITLGLNPAIYPNGTTVTPSFWAALIGGIAAIFGGGALLGSWASKSSDGGETPPDSGSGSMIESIMPIMIIMMMMGMMPKG